VKLIWSPPAMRNLENLADYIAEDSEQQSEAVEARIHEEAILLSRFPLCGRPGRIKGTRERRVRRTRYLLVYKIVSCQILILRVYHGTRQWPSHF